MCGAIHPPAFDLKYEPILTLKLAQRGSNQEAAAISAGVRGGGDHSLASISQ